MKKGDNDKPIYAFRRKGNSLVPEYEYDAGALVNVRENDVVRVEIKQFRQAAALRAYWKVLHDCIKSTECAPTVEALHRTIKLAVGLVDHIKLKDGTVMVVPASISIAAMDEPTFRAYFQVAEKWLAENIGYVHERRAA